MAVPPTSHPREERPQHVAIETGKRPSAQEQKQESPQTRTADSPTVAPHSDLSSPEGTRLQYPLADEPESSKQFLSTIETEHFLGDGDS